MEKSKKETIIGASIGICFIVLSILITYFAIVNPINELGIKQERIDNLFRKSDYNISDNYKIEWTNTFGLTFRNFKNTDWYYWEVEIYNINRPFKNGKIELWLNIETMETLYVGELP